HPDVELARHDRRRDEAAPRDRHQRVERAGGGEPPGERARVAVELVPRHREGLFAGGGHRATPWLVATGLASRAGSRNRRPHARPTQLERILGKATGGGGAALWLAVPMSCTPSPSWAR